MGDWSPLLKYRHSGWNNISKTSRTSRSQFRIQSRHPGNNSKIIINPTVCKNNYRAISLLEVLIVTRLLPGYYLLLHTSTRTTIYYAASSCQTVCLCAWIQFILAQSSRVCVKIRTRGESICGGVELVCELEGHRTREGKNLLILR